MANKKILDVIIDIAYKEENEERRKFYKWFTVELEKTGNNSYHGLYYWGKRN